MRFIGAHKIYIGVLMVVLLLNVALFCVPASLSAPVLSQWKENMGGAVAWVKPANAEETPQEVVAVIDMPEIDLSFLPDIGEKTAILWTKVTDKTGALIQGVKSIAISGGNALADMARSIGEGFNTVITSIENAVGGTMSSIKNLGSGIAMFTGNVVDGISSHIVKRSQLLWGMGKSGVQSVGEGIGNTISALAGIWHSMTDFSDVFKTADISVAEIEPAAGDDIKLLTIDELKGQKPAAGGEKETKRQTYRFPIEERRLETDAVLVPGQKAVISSSRDGKIKDIYVHNGDLFKKGDVLLEYVCADVKGEAKLNKAQEKIAQTRSQGSFRLLKLGLISDLEKLEMDAETTQVEAQADILEARMDDCRITAPFDGRVTNRLANPNEYTRTDRVLIEIAEVQAMNAEFVVPSRWLRWINVDAPLIVYLDDMDQKYEGEIIRIHGEVDPVSETVQVVGKINMLEDNLFPGMSGTVTLDAKDIRDQDIRGILEEKIILSDNR